jgi:hypothetical protein
MDIRFNNSGEIEYVYSGDFPDELVDISSACLNIMKEYYDDPSTCKFVLMDVFDLTIGEANNILKCKTEDFETHISGLFSLSEDS